MELKNTDIRDSQRLTHWLEAVRRLPPVRLGKVHRVREALRLACYENERMIDETVMCLSREFGISP